MREVERSLTRLGTDHIDLYLAHHPDSSTPPEETVSTFDRLIADGKFGTMGSAIQAWQVTKALWIADKRGLEPPACIQAPYNLISRSLEDEMFGLVRDQGLGVMAYSPLAVGLLSGVYSADVPPPTDRLWGSRWRDKFDGRLEGGPGRVFQAVREISTETGKTPAQIATAWVLANPAVSVAILGCDEIAQLDENLGALGWSLSEEHLAQLNGAGA